MPLVDLDDTDDPSLIIKAINQNIDGMSAFPPADMAGNDSHMIQSMLGAVINFLLFSVRLIDTLMVV